MVLYRQAIFSLAQSRKNEVFYNTDANHAEIVHQAIAKYAKNDINIFSGSLCTEISNNEEYCSSIESFLSSDCNHKINIILTDFSDDFMKSNIASVLRKYASQVDLRTWEGKVVRGGKPVHFTFADGCMFRLETDIDNHMAYGNFNSPEKVKNLSNIFNQITSLSHKYSWC